MTTDPPIEDWRFTIPRRCPDCDHSLNGLLDPRCPECGREFPPEWIAQETSQCDLSKLSREPLGARVPRQSIKGWIGDLVILCLLGGIIHVVYWIVHWMGLPWTWTAAFGLILVGGLAAVLLAGAWDERRNLSDLRRRRDHDIASGRIESSHARATEAVTLETEPADEHDIMKPPCLSVRLETGSILALDEDAVDRLGLRGATAMPRDLTVSWLPTDGTVVHMQARGSTIPIEPSTGRVVAVDDAMPGIWNADEFLFEISFEEGTTLFPSDADEAATRQ